jgi:hypothetical protein
VNNTVYVVKNICYSVEIKEFTTVAKKKIRLWIRNTLGAHNHILQRGRKTHRAMFSCIASIRLHSLQVAGLYPPDKTYQPGWSIFTPHTNLFHVSVQNASVCIIGFTGIFKT